MSSASKRSFVRRLVVSRAKSVASISMEEVARRVGGGHLMKTAECLLGHPRTRAGRHAQLAQVLFFAVLAAGGILLQVFSDVDTSVSRSIDIDALNKLNAMSFEVYDILTLLAQEMEVFYEFNVGPYEDFLTKAQTILKAVDAKLIYTENWPDDFSVVPEAVRANTSTSNAVRVALRNERDRRKGVNGTTEKEVLEFYSSIIDNLALVVRNEVLKSDRFPGWREMLTGAYFFQAYLNFKKYAVVGVKLAVENRTVGADDPVYTTLRNFHVKYTGFLDIAERSSAYGLLQVDNLTDQDAAKAVEKLDGYVAVLDFITIIPDDWRHATAQNDASMFWIFSSINARVRAAMFSHATTKSSNDIFSVTMYAIAGFIVVAAIFVHLSGTWRVQERVVDSYNVLASLLQSLNVLYDSVPRSQIKHVKAGDFMPVRYHPDATVLVMDITNITELMTDLEAPEFSELLSAFYEMIESNLISYNCVKVEVFGGSTICLASGIGEHHAIDPAVEMVYLALNLLDAVNEFNNEDMEDEFRDVHLRFGIHTGPCFARVLVLRIPQIVIFGPAMQMAAALHATSYASKVQVSGTVRSRLSELSDVTFSSHGQIDLQLVGLGEQKQPLEGFWASWTDEMEDDGLEYTGQ